MRPGHVFFGWWVAWTGFLMALFAWGLGFYGAGVYLAWFTEGRGWDLGALSAAITVYYVASAAIVFVAGDVYGRLGHRGACLLGTTALGAGALAMPHLTEPWMAWLALAVMAPGWALLGTAGVNIVLAPWFERRRGFVVSLALNGASMGGVAIAPVMVVLAGELGPAVAATALVGLMAATLGVFAVLTLGRRPTDLGLAPDGGPAAEGAPREAPRPVTPRAALLRSWRLWSVALPFAMALFVQVGVLTHLLRFLGDTMAPAEAALVLSLLGAMAVGGRVGTGFIVDRLDRRGLAGINFALQAAGLVVLVTAGGPAGLWAGALLFGLGVGNQVTLSGLIVQVEFPRGDFARVIGLVVAISQATYAFGPGVLGGLADATGSYGLPFGLAAGLLGMASLVVVAGRPRRGT